MWIIQSAPFVAGMGVWRTQWRPFVVGTGDPVVGAILCNCSWVWGTRLEPIGLEFRHAVWEYPSGGVGPSVGDVTGRLGRGFTAGRADLVVRSSGW